MAGSRDSFDCVMVPEEELLFFSERMERRGEEERKRWREVLPPPMQSERRWTGRHGCSSGEVVVDSDGIGGSIVELECFSMDKN